MKSKILFFSFCFFLFSFQLFADVIWDNYYNPFGATGINVRPHMAVCTDGGFAVTGYYVIEDPPGTYIEWCGYVMKISSDGELLWADKDTLSFPTAPTHESDAIIETSDGGLINYGDGYIIKRDSNGNRLWSQDLNIAPTTMCYSHDGNIVLSGGMPEGDCLFRIIDEEVNEILNNDFILGSNYTVAKRIIPTSDGGYAITGVVSDEIANTDIFICKTDAVGDTLWTYRKEGCGNSDIGNWIIENSENQLLCVGDLFPEPLTIRGYCAKFELNGELLQEEILDPDIGYNNIYTIDLPQENSFLITSCPNIIKCDYDFNIEWVQNEGLLPYYKKMDVGYIMYSNGVHLMRIDENIVHVENNVISSNQNNLYCYPNPFNPSTTICFSIPEYSAVNLSIYNIKGQKVNTIVNTKLEKGIHEVFWNARNEHNKPVASGVYFYKLRVNGRDYSIKKCLMLK